jgi:hypothetical protein
MLLMTIGTFKTSFAAIERSSIPEGGIARSASMPEPAGAETVIVPQPPDCLPGEKGGVVVVAPWESIVAA